MYLQLLAQNNKTFVNLIDRGRIHARTKRLDKVVKAVNDCQRSLNPSSNDLSALLQALEEWRTKEPKEYANRATAENIGYRLWMEAKQRRTNFFSIRCPVADPPVVGVLPGTLLLNVYVPPPSESPENEFCHSFAYRWLVASGRRWGGNPPFDAEKGKPSEEYRSVLYPGKLEDYKRARKDGVVKIQPGDLIGFFGGVSTEEPEGVLLHSVIAESADVWYGARNQMFGKPLGRSKVNVSPNAVTTGNGWRGMYNIYMAANDPLYSIYVR